LTPLGTRLAYSAAFYEENTGKTKPFGIERELQRSVSLYSPEIMTRGPLVMRRK